jgi:hypothetical protein
MPPVGFKPTISVGERPQTYALERAATGIGCRLCWQELNFKIVVESTAEGPVSVFFMLNVLLYMHLTR